jgi:hypothetical protein
MCEATQQLKRISYELDQQRGRGVIDLGKLRDMTTIEHCDEHQETA